MTRRRSPQVKILVVNCGSSSIKYKLFEMPCETVLASGLVEKIGEDTSFVSQTSRRGQVSFETPVPEHHDAFNIITANLTDPENGVVKSLAEVAAVGHRVVHGGERFVASTLVDDKVKTAIEEFCRLAPLHNPPNLTGIREAAKVMPDVPHVAVFDTAFHQTIPPRAWRYAIPNELYEKHRIRRYGFHGTSHRYVTLRAGELLGIPGEGLDIITCHLGNGCSITAVKDGKSVDTSMGFTPLEGVVMGTRCGNIDPAIPIFMSDALKMTPAEVDRTLNKASGLLGLSGVSNDMREVVDAADAGNESAKLALDVFAYAIRKYIGAYMAVLGGARAIVFTGGIGENDTQMRRMILDGLEGLGIVLDHAANADVRGAQGVITTPDSPVKALVIPTNEELLIARDTMAIAEAKATMDSEVEQ